jgi:soluble lytic murein transglycosylase-like protein
MLLPRCCVPIWPNRAVAGAAALFFVAAGVFSAAPVRAAGGSPSEQYVAALRNFPPRPGLTLDLAAQAPDTYRGMTLEVTGRLLGMARTDEGASLMLSTGRNGSLVLQMSRLPDWIQPGDRLRVLIVVAGNPTAGATIGMPDLEVVAVASAADIEAAEMRWRTEGAARRAARDRRSRAGMGQASAALRGGGTAAAGRRASLDARSAQLSRSLSPNARAVFEPYRAAIRSFNRRLSEREVDAITSSILLFSERYDVDPRLVMALMIAESSFNPNVTSHKGAMGLGQLMPAEANRLGLTNPYDPVQNIAGSIYLLRGRLDKYSGGAGQQNLSMQHIILALASYNAGMGAVKKYKGVPPYRETRNYVKKVERIYRQLCGSQGGAPS